MGCDSDGETYVIVMVMSTRVMSMVLGDCDSVAVVGK